METTETADTAAACRTAAGAGSTTNGATTALGLAALIDAVAGSADTDSAAGAATDPRVDSPESPESGLALSLSDAAADGLTFFTGTVDDECPEPDGFFADVLVDTSALATSAPVSSPDAGADDVVPVDPATELDDVVPVDADDVVPVDADDVVPVDPATDPDDVVPVDPATDPDVVEVVLDVDDASESGSAHATPVEQEKQIADPMPRATPNAPTRPT